MTASLPSSETITRVELPNGIIVLAYENFSSPAVVIGGSSLFGGEGTILGTLIGAAIMQILRNGLVLMGFPAYWQPAAIGAVIILAVMLDQWRKRQR